MNPQPFRALIVEDDLSWQQLLSEIISDSGIAVDISSNLEEAYSELKLHPHRVAIVDISLSPDDHRNIDGLRVLEAVSQLDPNCRSILLTGFATVELAVSSITDYGAYTFLRKDNFQRSQFQEVLSRILTIAPKFNDQRKLSRSNVDNLQTTRHLNSFHESRTAIRKAIVVEDDAGWRSIIEELLVDSGFVVRTSNSFGEALGYLGRDSFSLAVVDLSLNGKANNTFDRKLEGENLSGYQLLTNTHSAGIPTIIVSGLASQDDIKRAYEEKSVFAFLEKQTFDRKSFQRIVDEIKVSQFKSSEVDILTRREREVLNLLSNGQTNKEIAENLFITTNTVKRHIKAIFEKLDVHTRSAAAAKALGKK